MKKEIVFKILEFILILLFCVLVWLVADDIQIKQWIPLATPESRLILIAIIGLSWIFKLIFKPFLAKRAEKKLAASFLECTLQKIKSDDPSALQSFKVQMKELMKDLKAWQVLSGKKRISLQKLPLFLVIGPPNSGKSALLQHSGLDFSLLTHASKSEIKKTIEFPWFVTEQAVFLEYSRFEVKANWDETNNKEAWQTILKTLKQYKKGSAINGVIVAVDAVAFLQSSEEERQEKIDSLRHYIKDLYELVKTRFPLYLVLTKCDEISGFLEYFGRYSSEEREQAIGFTLTETVEEDKLNDILNTQYDIFVEQLKNKLLKLLQEQPEPLLRETLCFFPTQMALLKPLVIDGILSVFIPNKLYEIVDFRGLYFTSADHPKDAGIYNPLGALMTQKFGLTSETQYSLAQTNVFFLKKLFQEIIIPEAWLIEHHRYHYSLKYWMQYFFYGITMSVMLFGSLALIEGHFYNKHRAVQATHYLDALQARISANSPVLSVKEALPNWELFRKAWEVYSLDPHHWLLSYRVYQSPMVEERLKKALQKALTVEFLPLLLRKLEGLLKKEDDDFEEKEVIFKGYLVLGYPTRLPPAWLATAAVQSWQKNILLTVDERQALKKHLDFMLDNGFKPLRLNETLVNIFKSELFKKPLAFRVYRALNDKIKGEPNKSFDIFQSINKEGVFEEEVPIKLSEYYTQTGIAHLYVPEISLIIERLKKDDELIASVLNEPLKTSSTIEVTQLVNHWYAKDYTEHWQQLLFNLKLKPYATLDEAINGFTLLSSGDSPLRHLFKIVDTHLQAALALDKTLSMNNPLKALHLFLKEDNTGKNINPERLFKALEEMAKYLNALKEKKDILKASYEATEGSLKSHSVTAINELMQAAKQLPEPLQGWIETLGESTWEILLKNTNAYLNERWQKEVMVSYQKIRGYFPLEVQEETEISLKSFGEFFGRGGIIEKFMGMYLEPYLDHSIHPWQWKCLYGHCVSDSNNAAEQLQRLAILSRQLYTEEDKGFLMHFWLTPHSLSVNTASMHLKIGTKEIIYRHGPQSMLKFNWQPTTQVERIIVNFRDFGEENISKSFAGEWGLLRLMKWGSMVKDEGLESYRFKIQLEDYQAEFLLKVEEQEALETLLEGVELPDYF